MTNILLLPKFNGQQSSFSITTNGDWLDAIFFGAPDSPSAPISLPGSQITSGQNTITVTSTIGIMPGMPISQVPGIPSGAYVGSITSATQLTMVNGSGSALNATATDAEATLFFQPIPLDLTGILFTAQLRSSTNSQQIYVTASTATGTLLNGGTSGVISFNVPQAQLANIPPGSYVIDIVATGDGHTINLFPQGPATVTVSTGITQLS